MDALRSSFFAVGGAGASDPVSRSIEAGGGMVSLGLTGRPDDGSDGRGGRGALTNSPVYTPASRGSGAAPRGVSGCASLHRLRGR